MGTFNFKVAVMLLLYFFLILWYNIVGYNMIHTGRGCFMNTYRIKIFNRELNITTDETLEYTQALADRLNEKLSEIVSGVGNMTLSDAAVLVSLDCLDKAVRSEESVQNIRQQIKSYADDASKTRQELVEKENEISKLQKRIKELEQKGSVPQAKPYQKPSASNVFVNPKKDDKNQKQSTNTPKSEQTSFFK